MMRGTLRGGSYFFPSAGDIVVIPPGVCIYTSSPERAENNQRERVVEVLRVAEVYGAEKVIWQDEDGEEQWIFTLGLQEPGPLEMLALAGEEAS